MRDRAEIEFWTSAHGPEGAPYLVNEEVRPFECGEVAASVSGTGRYRQAATWERRLDALETEVYRTRRERRRRGTTDQRQENAA